jgi:Flp pilus assembly protein TadG
MRNYIKRIRQLRKDGEMEGGNTFVMYVMMFGIMAIFLGYAIDSGLGFYTKNGMQSALDSAVVAGASEITANSSGKTVINKERATERAKNAFNDAKVNYPNLVTCNHESKCEKFSGIAVKTDPTRGQYFTMTATIYSKNVFMHMVGLPVQEYNLKSEARLGYVQE